MICPVEPTGEYLVLAPVAPDARSPGGIHLPDSAHHHQPIGVVLAIGPRVDPVHGFAMGDRVFYHAGASFFRVRVGREEYVAVHQSLVFARLMPVAPEGVPEGLA